MKKFTKTKKKFSEKTYNYRQQKQEYKDMEADKMLSLMYLGYYDDDDEKEGVVLKFDL